MSQLYEKPGDAVDFKRHNANGEIIVEQKSPGVRYAEAVGASFTKKHYAVFWLLLLLWCYVYGADGSVRNTYTATAASMVFKAGPQISALMISNSVVSAGVMPLVAKLCDYFGRVPLLFLAVVFYVLGTIVQAAAPNFGALVGGAVLYYLGFSGVMMLLEVIISDFTSLRSRLFFILMPPAPIIITAWTSGNIADLTLKNAGWRWGIGMWGIMYPIVGIPVFLALIAAERRAKRKGLLEGIPRPYTHIFSAELWRDFFWQADVVGLILLMAAVTLIMVPFTLGGQNLAGAWKTARLLTPLLVGLVIALPAFVIWEVKFARHPVLPGRLLRRREILCAILIPFFMNAAVATQSEYLYYTLLIAFNRDVVSATRVTQIYRFCYVVVGLIIGLFVRRVRRLKYFILFGAVLFLVAFGLLIRYRGGHSTAEFAGLIGAEVVLGVATGFVPYPVQIILQASVGHERMATVTATWLCLFSIGMGVGSTIGSAIWNNTLPKRLTSYLIAAGAGSSAPSPDAAMGEVMNITMTAFLDPVSTVMHYPVGTPERVAIDNAYRDVQRYLCIAGICISLCIGILALGLNNPELTDKQSIPDVEKSSVYTLDSETSTQADGEVAPTPDAPKAIETPPAESETAKTAQKA